MLGQRVYTFLKLFTDTANVPIRKVVLLSLLKTAENACFLDPLAMRYHLAFKSFPI